MGDEKWSLIAASAVLITFLLMTLLMHFVEHKMENHYQDEAVKHHAAHYYLDEDNNKQWAWNDQNTKAEIDKL